jgi:hypothetical protein
MQISKLYLVVCAAAFCAGGVAVRADDNPAQAAAIAAMEAKMRELNSQPAATNAQTSAPAMPEQSAQPAAATPSASPAPAQPARPAATMTSTPPQAAGTTSAAQAAALAAMAQKMNELNAQQPQPTRSPAVSVTPSGATVLESANPSAPMTTAPAQATMSSASSGNSLFAPVPPSSGGASPEAAPEQRMPSNPVQTTTSSASSGTGLFAPVPPSSGSTSPGAASEPGTPSTTAQAPAPTGVQPPGMGSSQPFNASTTGQQLGFQPIVAPPLPISAAQQAQLQALLQKYDANTITPEQYQAERAKILAERKQK